MHFRHHFVSSSDFVHRRVCVMTLRAAEQVEISQRLYGFSFTLIWVLDSCSRENCREQRRPAAVGVSDGRRQPNCSRRVAHVARPNSLTTERLSDWFKVTVAWQWWTEQERESDSQDQRMTGRDGWEKKKNSAERDCIFGSALPWPLAHFISLLSVLLLNAVPPTAAVVSFFIVWYKMRLNQRVNGFTRLHMFFGAVEFLRKDCGLTFPSQPLSFSSPAQIVGQQRQRRSGNSQPPFFPCANLPIQQRAIESGISERVRERKR